jgi:hypothetical protein
MVIHSDSITHITHDWLHSLSLAYIPTSTSPLLDEFSNELREYFGKSGNQILENPSGNLDLLLTTAPFGEPLNWRKAALFTARKRFQLEKAPVVVTLVHTSYEQYDSTLRKLQKALSKQIPDPHDYDFPGLAQQAYLTLHEQGRRGGAILALERLLQAQTKSIRIILVIGDRHPDFAYCFDLVGAHPRIDANDMDGFYRDLVMRIMTAVSTHEVTNHKVINGTIPFSTWQSLKTPASMREAGLQLGRRNFFSEMININNLVNVPAVPETVANQYSEGCFASWDPVLKALIATVTGSAKPINKYDLTEEDLAVVMGVRPDHQGALVRWVEGKSNPPPSSEAVELIQMDSSLPDIVLNKDWEDRYGKLPHDQSRVPVARSKLHGHRGVGSFDPRFVEHVQLEAPYYYYPVACGSEAQANAIVSAFSRSQALNHPSDAREVVFTVLPGHGIVIVEKWVSGKAPFQVIWEYMDAGYLEVVSRVPQGMLAFEGEPGGRKVLRED